MNDFDYFALLLIKESKNKTMEIKIIVIHDAQNDFDMKLEIVYLKIDSSNFNRDIDILD